MRASTPSLPDAGTLLVATPALVDPNFSRSVVLILTASEEGAVGVIINRPSEIALRDVLPQWQPTASIPDVIFIGGPVSPQGAIALGLSPGPMHGSEGLGGPRLFGGRLATVDLADERPAAGFEPVSSSDIPSDRDGGRRWQALRVFAGYSGWDAEQLDAEITEGSWFVVPALPADAFDPEPETHWRRVLRRQRGMLALVSTFPDDPREN